MNLETIGELEADVLSILESKKSATISDITLSVKLKRDVTYSTIATTLSRLHRKGLAERKPLVGPGGVKYLYTEGKDEDVKIEIVEASLTRLIRAFGPEIYEVIYTRVMFSKNTPAITGSKI